MKKVLVLVSFLLININASLAQTGNSIIIHTNKTVKEEPSRFDIIFGYIKDISGPTIALLGIIVAVPILRKKLVASHITSKLNEIQTANSSVQSFNLELIDKYTPLTFSNDLLEPNDLKVLLLDLRKIFHISQKASSDVATLTFFLKTTLEGTIKHYDTKTSKRFSTRSLLGFVIENLELINFYASQVVQVPKSSKTKGRDLINKKIKKYVTHSQIKQYKHFKLGIIEDANSAHFTLFSSSVNARNHILLMRATFQIYWSPNAIAKLLYLNKIYAPSILSIQESGSFFHPEPLNLFLIGFSSKRVLSKDPDAPSEKVELIYSNPDDFYLFVNSLTYEKIKKSCEDIWITNSYFQIDKSLSMTKQERETFTLSYDEVYLKTLFKKNKRVIRKKLKQIS